MSPKENKIQCHKVKKQLQLVFRTFIKNRLQQDRDLNIKMKIHRNLKKLEAKKNRVKEEQLNKLISIEQLLLGMIHRSVNTKTQ